MSAQMHNDKQAGDMQAGMYGKLPAYGDFIFRNLNTAFITPWDEWLQHFISGSQEQMGEGWLDIYLTSPIWRFVLSPGVIDNNMWAGLMMPSVDRVGRYFPVSIVKPFASNISPVNFMLEQTAWYAAVESHCLSALNGELDADALVNAIAAIEVSPQQNYQATYHLGEMGPVLYAMPPEAPADGEMNVEAGLEPGLDLDRDTDLDMAMNTGMDTGIDTGMEGFSQADPQPANNTNIAMQKTLPYMLNATMATSLSSFSIWQTSGSALVSPVLFSCQGLPPIGGIASMLDGQWQQRNWKIPYNLV